MPQTYAFQVSMPVTDMLPRNRISNTLHFEHSLGALLDTDLSAMAGSLVSLYQTRYGDATKEVLCKVYDVDAVPNYPRATVITDAGVPWITASPREIALVLSFAGSNRGNRSERGRIYLAPGMGVSPAAGQLRPSLALQTWAIEWYSKSNESFPDLGGIDWKFGIWSRRNKKFTQAQQAWVNDDWDVQRRRGLRETSRLTSVREG